MYVIKTIYFDTQRKRIDIKDGITLEKSIVNGSIKAPNAFWRKTNIAFEKPMSYEKLEDGTRGEKILSAVSDYRFEDREFYFNVKETESEKKEGYFLVIKHQNCQIKTSGEIIFTMYTTDTVVLLKDGDYLEVDTLKIEVIKNRLMTEI